MVLSLTAGTIISLYKPILANTIMTTNQTTAMLDDVPLTPKLMGDAMMRVGQRLITSTAQVAYLRDRNLRVGAAMSVAVLNPRQSRKAKWFGVDGFVSEPGHTIKRIADNRKLKTIEALVTRYLSDKDENVDDYIYSGVDNSGYHEYCLISKDARITEKCAGVIMISRETLMNMCADVIAKKDITGAALESLLQATAEEQFVWEVGHYSAWQYGMVFDVTVCTNEHAGVKLSKTIKECYGVQNQISREVSDAADAIAYRINETDGSLKVTLQMDTKVIDGEYMRYVSDGIQKEFDFVFTVGSTTEDYNTGILTMVILPQEIPNFQELIHSSGYHLIALMQKYVGDDAPDTWDVVNMLMNPLPFHEWSTSMQTALLKSIFAALHNIELLTIEPSGEPLDRYEEYQ